MTLRNRLEGLEQRARLANQGGFTIRELLPGETFEEKFGHPQGPNEFVLQYVDPPVWPDGFDASKPAPE